MTKEELAMFTPRKNGVIVKETKTAISTLILLGDGNKNLNKYTYSIFAKGPKVEELEVGEEVFPMMGALAELNIDNLNDNESFYYCEDSFIKLRRINNL